MLLWKRLWHDDAGVVLSAEAVLVGSIMTVGAVAGLSTIGRAVDSELREVGFAIRSLDQSYAYNGHVSSVAWTAGSAFVQPDVEASLADLGTRAEADAQAFQAQREAYRQQTDTKPDPKDEPSPKEKAKEKRKRMKKAAQIDDSLPDRRLPNDLPPQSAGQ